MTTVASGCGFNVSSNFRSFTGVAKDNFAAQGELVAKVLPGWYDVDLATIEVQDKSGYGGSRYGNPPICH